MPSKIYSVIIEGFKNIYGRFWETPEGHFEYYLQLDGYYYCKKQKCVMVIIQIRNKRTIDKLPVEQAVIDKELIKALHPIDACIVGILANNERNQIIDKSCENWRNMKRFKHSNCFIKSKPILYISKKYFDHHEREINSVLFCSAS